MEPQQRDPETHKRLGIDLFNKTWSLLKKEMRTRDEDDEMLHCAHASAYHWLQVGTRANRARSEWQCSRVYAMLGRAEPALAHARRCLELVESAPDEMQAFAKFLRQEGLYTFVRWHTFFTNPPLCITENELREGFGIIDRALDLTDKAVQ